MVRPPGDGVCSLIKPSPGPQIQSPPHQGPPQVSGLLAGHRGFSSGGPALTLALCRGSTLGPPLLTLSKAESVWFERLSVVLGSPVSETQATVSQTCWVWARGACQRAPQVVLTKAKARQPLSYTLALSFWSLESSAGNKRVHPRHGQRLGRGL